MRPGLLETDKLTDTKTPTDDSGLYSFMYLAVLVLQGRLIVFTYRQAAQTGKGKYAK